MSHAYDNCPHGTCPCNGIYFAKLMDYTQDDMVLYFPAQLDSCFHNQLSLYFCPPTCRVRVATTIGDVMAVRAVTVWSIPMIRPANLEKYIDLLYSEASEVMERGLGTL